MGRGGSGDWYIFFGGGSGIFFVGGGGWQNLAHGFIEGVCSIIWDMVVLRRGVASFWAWFY